MRITFFSIIVLLSVCAAATQAQDEDYTHPELNWYTIETPHFYVNYHNGEERTAKVIAKVAEDIYGPVTSLYHHEPDQKVRIVVKDYDDYSNGGAYFYDNKIEIWAPALDFDLRGTHDWLRNVVTHEFTHIVQIQTSMKFGRRVPGIYFQWLGYEAERRQDVLYGYPNVIVSYPISGFAVPSWFAEGVAQYNRPELSYDSWDSHRDMILRMYALDNNMLTWDEMSVFGKTSLGNESSYNAGFALVKYISETYGEDAIPRIAKNLSRLTEVNIGDAIERAVGKSGRDVYNDWKEHVTAEYKRRTEPIFRHRVEGKEIASVGFGNFYPAYSPDGKKIAYTSNKEEDYFGLSSIYVYDVDTKTEKELVDKVHSSLSWSPDGKRIYYAKITHDNPYWSDYSDVYVCDVATGDETRLTYAARAINPSVSPDGKKIVYATESDGTMNICVVDADGKNIRQLTRFTEGEQVFTPKWSPDSSYIVFGYATRDAQDVARVSVVDGTFEDLIRGEDDARNPVYSSDGKKILFVSDRTGIFNIYSYDVATKAIQQITNVLGGAFMPTVNQEGDIAYASYTSTGFKIGLLKKAEPQNFAGAEYLPPQSHPLASLSSDTITSQRYSREKHAGMTVIGENAGHLPDTSAGDQFNWNKLRAFDDTKLPDDSSRAYKTIFNSLSIIPLIRIDNYNTKNKGFDDVKLGGYFLSSDVLDKYSIFGGAAINRQLERDIFFQFEYRDRIIGLWQLGWAPVVSFEIYNITRNSNASFELFTNRPVNINLGITYGLLEFDLLFRQHLFMDSDLLTFGITYSRYSTDISSFVIPGDANYQPIEVPGSSDLYFKGTDLSLQYQFEAIQPSRDADINPVGVKLNFRYDYELNRFNATGEYEASGTGLNPKLDPFDFHRAEFHLDTHVQLPGWKHTLSLSLRGGAIFGPAVPDFFDFYAGGLAGMKGYPFYSIGGNEIAAANLTYRFPLWENIDARFLQFYFDKLYASVHGDFGDAWTGNPAIRNFKKDAGFELRLESNSFYAYPTRIFFNGTYGFDSFSFVNSYANARYGKEWRFYFGVLFDFDVE
ncbi:MAG: PD40 domain-containing protein [Bacteroidota bacterium]|nr:PD40 domain-containing protein [Bacteroidota bacterium]